MTHGAFRSVSTRGRPDHLEPAGFEALVRFESGQRPDHCFADARRVGAGVALELAIRRCHRSRPSAPREPVALNASPAVLADPGRCERCLNANWPIVLEVTEHEVIHDYVAFRESSRPGANIRIAVDDVRPASPPHIASCIPTW
jgi:EAL domain-containing protein (putative c-di-GMP-specific phosphodiesterase class I)